MRRKSVFEVILIFILSLIPPMLSVIVMRKAEERARVRLRAAMEATAVRGLQRIRQPLEGSGYLIGDITCQYNARSTYIRCAVNPVGPCEECRSYQPREFS